MSAPEADEWTELRELDRERPSTLLAFNDFFEAAEEERGLPMKPKENLRVRFVSSSPPPAPGPPGPDVPSGSVSCLL